MKKTLAVILSLLLVMMFSNSTALAKPGHAKSNANNGSKKTVTVSDKSAKKSAVINKIQPKQISKVTVKSELRQQIRIKQELKDQLRIQTKFMNQPKTKVRFSDVNKHWASQSIQNMAALGLLNGYPDGSFKPDDSITQAEAISLVMRLAAEDETDTTVSDNEETTEENSNFSEEENPSDLNGNEEDTSGNEDESSIEESEDTDSGEDESVEVPGWAKNATKKAAKKGFINMNRFHSHVQASRAQTAVWIAKAIGLEPVDTSDLPFTDGILITSEDAGYIMALYQEGIIAGSPSGKFNPNSAITRAEMAAIIQRILEKQDDTESDDDMASDETGTDESTTDQSTTDETGTDESSTGQITDETGTDDTVADETTADENVTDDSAANESTSDETTADETAAGETSAE